VSTADPGKPDGQLPLPAFRPRDAIALTAQQREAVIDRLTRSFAEDALTMDEFERRAELAYSAASLADLQALVSDLPAEAPAGDGRKSSGTSIGTIRDRITTVLGNTERGMPGTMPRFLRIRTLLGNTELDFRQSTFEPGVTEVNVRCLLGNVELTVPEGVRVEILCSSVLANVGVSKKPGAGDADWPGILLDNPAAHQFPAESTTTGVSVDAGAGADLLAANPSLQLTTSGPAIKERVLRITGRAILGNVEIHRGSLRREP